MTMSSRTVRYGARIDSPAPSVPYTGAVSMKLIPASSAALIMSWGSSLRPHQSLTSVQVPKPTSETTRSLFPNRRVRMVGGYARDGANSPSGETSDAVVDDRPGDL